MTHKLYSGDALKVKLFPRPLLFLLTDQVRGMLTDQLERFNPFSKRETGMLQYNNGQRTQKFTVVSEAFSNTLLIARPLSASKSPDQKNCKQPIQTKTLHH